MLINTFIQNLVIFNINLKIINGIIIFQDKVRREGAIKTTFQILLRLKNINNKLFLIKVKFCHFYTKLISNYLTNTKWQKKNKQFSMH